MKSAAVQTLKLSGREFVILPRREYDRLLSKKPVKATDRRQQQLTAQDRGDVAEARRRLRSLAGGRSQAIAVEKLKAELGL